jgi:hypothetical protein
MLFKHASSYKAEHLRKSDNDLIYTSDMEHCYERCRSNYTCIIVQSIWLMRYVLLATSEAQKISSQRPVVLQHCQVQLHLSFGVE